LAISFFSKFFNSLVHSHKGFAEERKSFREKIPKYSLKEKSLSLQTHNFEKTESVGINAAHISAKKHVTGSSVFVDDNPPIKGELYGVLITSSIPCGEIISIDVSEALKVASVKGVFTHKDIPLAKSQPEDADNNKVFAEKRDFQTRTSGWNRCCRE
jgi:xanthine dehydrogenase molybdopterin-binding subunit B